MDTLSHALLGAAIGQMGPGRRVGNRALAAGAAIALVPDIDVPLGYLMGDAAALTFHRGITHSIIFVLCMGPLIGVLLHRLWSDHGVSRRGWMLFATAVLISHLVLDTFTSYGIQLLLPFSDHSFAIASISVIDPVYTLPLLATMVVVPWLARQNRWRTRLAVAGVLVSSAFLLLTLHNQQRATEALQAGMREAGIPAQRLFVKPTLFNNVLWRGIGETDTGYFVGFHSLLDRAPPDNFVFFPRNEALLAPHRDEPIVQDLIKVSEGYYQVVDRDGELYFHDLRYGQAFEWLRDDRPHVFTYRLLPGNGVPMDIETISLSRDPEGDRQTLEALIDRARGR